MPRRTGMKCRSRRGGGSITAEVEMSFIHPDTLGPRTAAAYAKAWEEQTGQKIDKTGIIWLKSSKRGPSRKEGVFQGHGWELKVVEDIDENFELFKLIYKLYALENPTTEPIYKEYPTTLRL